MRRAGWSCVALALACCHRGAEPAGGAGSGSAPDKSDKSDKGDKDDDEHAAPVDVTCEPAQAAADHARIELRGVVGTPPERSATVSAAVAGRILTLTVHEGDRVAAGAPLATIDDPALRPAVTEGEAALGAAQAQLENADAALARAKRLVGQGIAPRRDVEDAAARRATAAAELASATAKRDLARQQQARARVVAPIAGTVIHLLRHAGELVDGTAATPLLELADPSTLELRADVPAAQLVQLAAGQTAEVALDALPAQPLAAEIVAVSPAVDTATALGSVRARLAAAPAGVHLALGLAGALRVDVPRAAGGVSVPAVALRRATSGVTQVVVCDGAVAKVVEVTVGARDKDRVEITKGVAVGDRVVTTHVVGIEDGAALVVKGAK